MCDITENVLNIFVYVLHFISGIRIIPFPLNAGQNSMNKQDVKYIEIFFSFFSLKYFIALKLWHMLLELDSSWIF